MPSFIPGCIPFLMRCACRVVPASIRSNRGGMLLPALAAVLLAGCAQEPLRPIARLSPEQLAAIALPGPAAAEQATRLTEQADREAQAARDAAHEAERRRELELQRRRDYERWRSSLGLGLGYGHGDPRWGWGANYRHPFW